MTATAVLADDEPLLLDALKRELAAAWPTLDVVALVNNGTQAIAAILEHRPSVVFLDIQMPGANGLEVAQAIAEDWPYETESPLPLVVFATAFDQYAIAAFEAAAVDYLLKPVKSDRLAQTVDRVQARLEQAAEGENTGLLDQLRTLLQSTPSQQPQDNPHLQIIRASVGNTVRVIPIGDVIFFESADKYVTVHTATGESLVREPLKNLLPQLDPSQFQQIHRRTIVNLSKVETATKDDKGTLTLQLQGTPKHAVVSRVYRHLFQAM